ncbi:MAG TPA: amidohydrolase family protein [Stellaceae bacterium]|nr:amidohydrolase family protein [Stellaceae bacterium]
MSDPAVLPQGAIDFHAHVLHAEAYARTVNHNVISGFGMRAMEPRPTPDSPRWPIFAKMTDPMVQLADMDHRGIAHAVISTSTVSQSSFFADGAEAAELDRMANEAIADWVRAYPTRFTGTFTLPLQDMPRALAELEHAVRHLKLRIANLPAAVGPHYLGHDYFRPIWEAIADLGAIPFVHPDGIKDPAFQEYSLWNGIGQGIEETRAMASLIYEGTFERHPGLEIVISHAGGFLPTYIARLDRNATAHPPSMRNLRRKPSEYLRHFHFDTVTYDPLVCDIVAARVGVDRLVFGSDYPFGDVEPLKLFDACAFDAESRRLVEGGNARQLLARATRA